MSDNDARVKAALYQYQVIGARRSSYDTLVWAVPAFELVAQAVLLQIALSIYKELSWVSAMFLFATIVLNAVSLIVMVTHRRLERMDSTLLEAIERKLNLPHAHERPHRDAAHRPVGPVLGAVTAFGCWCVVHVVFFWLQPIMFVWILAYGA